MNQDQSEFSAQGCEEVPLLPTVATAKSWVLVAEYRPALAGMYLCYHPDHGMDVFFHSGKSWSKTSFWNWEDPTHWRDLPEAPEVSEAV